MTEALLADGATRKALPLQAVEPDAALAITSSRTAKNQRSGPPPALEARPDTARSVRVITLLLEYNAARPGRVQTLGLGVYIVVASCSARRCVRTALVCSRL